MLKTKTVLTATIGNAIVYYDMTLYGFFTAFLSPLFFPAENLLTSQLASLGVFAAGFVARPFGGLIFGHIGDRYGRKKALVIAILLVTIPTTIIGLLPTYASIGILAPIILVMCKLMQGICTGGEYSGAAIFLSEHHRGHNEGLAGSILPASSIVGAILGTSLGGFCLLPEMPTWAWRIPFLLGGLLGIIGYMLRSALMESPEFVVTQKGNHLVKLPILEVIKRDKQAFFCAFGISTYNIVLFYIPVVYIAQFMLPKEALASSGMFLNTGLMFLLIVLLPLMGFAADRLGKERIMKASVVTSFLLSLPLFFFLNHEPSLIHVFIVLIVFGFLMSASVAPSVSFLPTLFPIQERYSAMAMAIGLGEAFGGTTPLICHGFVTAMGTPIAPAFYLMLCSFLGWIAIKYSSSLIRNQEELNLKSQPLPLNKKNKELLSAIG
jgi:MHS family proline/betaine transporter-like MFS transporter